MLRVDDLHCNYDTAEIVGGVSFAVEQGEVLAVLGRNGMGKTTLVRAIAGIRPPRVTGGSVSYRDERIDQLESFEVARRGIGYVPQGRHIFGSLTVVENLEVIARQPANGAEAWTVERVFDFFPRLGERLASYGRNLSGGEQQMLAIGRALMAKPRLLLLDEPSLGLAPVVVDEVFAAIETISRDGVSVLLVEQEVERALQIANRGYLLGEGRVVTSGDSESLRHNDDVRHSVLGL